MRCRACGELHPSHMRCEVWAAQFKVREPVVEASVVVSKVKAAPAPVVGPPPGLQGQVAAPIKAKFDRKGYMREYMRKVRERLRAGK